MIDERQDFEHESYGLLSISRVNGGPSNLFGTNLKFHNKIELEVKTAIMSKHLHRNWYHSRKVLLTIEMSPNQWAEAITNMNCGDGIPCTIRHAEGRRMENPPDDNRVQDVKDDFRKSLKNIGTNFGAARKRVAELLEKKALGKADREELTSLLQQLEQSVMSNLPFVEESFNEAVEEATLEAKVEIEAHASMIKGKLGEAALDALNSGAPVILSFGTDDKKLKSPE